MNRRWILFAIRQIIGKRREFRKKKNKNKKFIFLTPKITNNETIEICINTNKIQAHI